MAASVGPVSSPEPYEAAPRQRYMPAPAPPPYPASPPSWAPPPARRRRSRWLTIGLPLGGVLLLGGCATVVGLVVSVVRTELGPAQDATDAYAQALVEERWDDAHALLCAQDQAGVTASDLAAHYAEPDLTGYRIDGVNVSSVNGAKSAQAEITFTTADGLTDRTSLPLVPDGAAWRPCP